MVNEYRESSFYSATHNVFHSINGIVPIMPNLTDSNQRYYITDVNTANTQSTASVVKILNGARTLMWMGGPASSNDGDRHFITPLRCDPAAGISFQIMSGTAQIMFGIGGFIGK